jgi:hypothetical protein
MAELSPQLRTVAWGDVFPWLMLVRALRLATSAPLLATATVAVLLLPVGWRVAGLVPADAAAQPRSGIARWDDVAAAVEPQTPFTQVVDPRVVPRLRWPGSWREFVAPMLQVLPGGLQPLRHLFTRDASWGELGFFALGTLWNVLVWAFFGAIIVRTAVMQFGRDERVGLVDAARFAARRYWTFVGTPLFQLALVALLVLLCLPAGWLLRFDVGAFLVALVWIFVLLGGVLAAVVFVGLLLGWPLMWGASSAEEMGDVFEATQRSFSYAFGRPLHYAWYALVTLLVGSAAYVVVQWMAEVIVYLSFWLVSWGWGAASLDAVSTANPWRAVGWTMIEWLSQLVLTVASAFRYAYFWCAAGVTYLLLRRDSDKTEFDVVYVPEQPVRYALPPLTTDEAGVPGVE